MSGEQRVLLVVSSHGVYVCCMLLLALTVAASGLALSDRFNRFLCHSQRFGVDTPPIMPSFCEVIHGGQD